MGGDNFRSQKRYVNVKKDRGSLRQNPYLPFQNAKITGDYYIVPTVQSKTEFLDDKPEDHQMRIGLSIEKIGNPSVEKREPMRAMAVSYNKLSTGQMKDPNDKNSSVRLTEKERMVLYPQLKTRYSKPLRDHDLVECNDPGCPQHAHEIYKSSFAPSRNATNQTHDGTSNVGMLRSGNTSRKMLSVGLRT